MPEVVDSHGRPAHSVACLDPVAANRIRAHLTIGVLDGVEQQAVWAWRSELRDVRCDELNHVRRHRHAPSKAVLRRPDDRLPAVPDDCATHVDDAAREVDVSAPQLGQLTEPESTPRGDEDERVIPLRHLSHERLDLRRGGGVDGDLPFRDAGASDVARVPREDVVTHRLVEDRAQQ